MIHATSRGEGETPVVLLHGFLGSGRNLSGIASRLIKARPDLRAWLVDLPEHGDSPPTHGAPSFSAMTRALEAWLAETFESPYHLIGHSLGGRIALALRASGQVALHSLTLLDIAPGPLADVDRNASRTTRASPKGNSGFTADIKNVLDVMRAAPDSGPSRSPFREHFLSKGLSEPMTDWLLMNLKRTPDGLVWRVQRDRLAQLHQNTRDLDLWPALETPEPSTQLSVRGGTSPFVTDDDVSRLQTCGFQCKTLPGAGHFVHMDAPAELTEILDGFLPR